MIKLLHICAHLGGGAGKAISGIVNGLDNYENTILILEEPVQTKYVIDCQKKSKVIISNDLSIIRELAKNSDVVFLNWWCHPLFVYVFKALTGIKARLILWSHINGLNYPYLSFEFLNNFQGLLFTSPCTYENRFWSETERQNIISMSNIVYGMGEFYPHKNQHKHDYFVKNVFKIGYTGTLSFNKLTPDFPFICDYIGVNCPDSIFLLYGNSNEQFRNNFKENVVFMSFSNNIESELIKMDIFCYPLIKENYATTENSIIEAMAAGLPIIVMDNPPERHIITHKKTGLIAQTPKEVIEYIILLKNDIELRRKLGVNAREEAIKKYSYNKNIMTFISMIEKVCKVDKDIYDFNYILGDTPWDFFKHFCGNDFYLIEKVIDGENIDLPNIYFGNSKSSFEHFRRYFDDERFNIFKEI